MATGQLAPLLHYLRALATPGVSLEIPDAELLSRFCRLRDEAAFTALVRRHGPMVLAVCRRVLRDVHTAEDAFQATFLILARKADSLSKPELLGHWLHGVAYRTAVKARTEAVRRRTHERRAVIAQEIAGDDDFLWRDLRAVLDEEVNRLPNRYRVPVVLCYLQGQTNAEAARRLGCSRGTVATLLARAREKLRRRLTQRGVSLSVGVALAALVRTAEGGAVPRTLEQVTVKAATLLAAGQTSALGALAVHAVALAKGVSKGMLIEKLKLPVAILMMTALAGMGAGVTAYCVRAQAGGVAEADSEDKPRTADKTERPRRHITAPAAPERPQLKPQPTPAHGKTLPASLKEHLPAGSPPVQALAFLDDDDGLYVFRLVNSYQPVTEIVTLKNGQKHPITYYEEKSHGSLAKYNFRGIHIHDTKGHAVDKKELRKRLKREQLVLISANGRSVDPLHLRLFKEDTLIFVLPSPTRALPGKAPIAPAAPSGYAPPVVSIPYPVAPTPPVAAPPAVPVAPVPASPPPVEAPGETAPPSGP